MTTTNDAAQTFEHVIGERGRLAIHLASAEIRLVGIDGDRVVVRTPSGRPLTDRISIEPADDGLTIRERDGHGISFGRGRRVAQLAIDVPRGAEVSVAMASGWLDALDLTGEQRYRATSSETRLRGVAGDIELSTVSGDATIELGGATQLSIKSVSGDVRVSGGRLDALRVATTSGDVRVESPLVGSAGNRIETLSGDAEIVAGAGIRVEARTISGDLTSDLPHRSEGRMGRRTLVVGDGSIALEFRSVSGDLRIRDRARHADPTRPPEPPSPHEPPTPFSDDDRDIGDRHFDDLTMPDIRFPDITLPRITLPDLGSLFGGERRAGDAGSDVTEVAVDANDVGDTETERMAILRAIERGEIDVATAMDRLAALDDAADGEADRV